MSLPDTRRPLPDDEAARLLLSVLRAELCGDTFHMDDAVSEETISQMLALSKEIKESEIRHHPERNFVIRVMGVEWEKPMYELIPPEKLKKCQAFLLCTDGFWELIEESEMCAFLREADTVEEWLNNMTETVKRNGAGTNMDNYSAIAVWNTK